MKAEQEERELRTVIAENFASTTMFFVSPFGTIKPRGREDD